MIPRRSLCIAVVGYVVGLLALSVVLAVATTGWVTVVLAGLAALGVSVGTAAGNVAAGMTDVAPSTVR